MPPSRNRPLSPLNFWMRNRGKAVPLIGVILLAVMLVCGIVAMMNSIPHSIRTIYSYSKEFVAVTPRGDPTMTPKIVAKIKTESPVPVERIILCRATGIMVMSIVGKWPFVNIGLKPEDAKFYLETMGVSRISGRMPKPGAAEVLISRPVAVNLRKSIGDALQKPTDQENYSPAFVGIVGIAETDKWLVVGDYTYQKVNHFPPVDGVLAFAADRSRQDELDRWTYEAFKGERASVLAFFDLDRDTELMFRTLYRILNVVIATLVLVITIMMGMLINIYTGQRLIEFGLLQALGYTKTALLRRVAFETVIIVITGWFLGVASSIGLLVAVDHSLMRPNAFAFMVFDDGAFGYTLPIPIAILAVALATVALKFRRFDPVAIVERRVL